MIIFTIAFSIVLHILTYRDICTVSAVKAPAVSLLTTFEYSNKYSTRKLLQNLLKYVLITKYLKKI